MTHQARPQPIPIPISALLPPSRESGPSKPLPFPSAAVQGPLPPTSAIHLALNWLAVSDLPEYTAVDAEQSSSKHLATALIITGSKAGFADSIEEDDEDWLRYHAGDYGVLYRLKRVDIRQHLLLLLTTVSKDNKANPRDGQILRYRPGLVILWDVARLFMEVVEGDENLPPEEVAIKQKEEMVFKRSVSLSQYMDVIAAARSTVDHLSSLDPLDPQTQLIVLEPSLTHLSSLPILRASAEGDAKAKISKPTRERRVLVADGLKWMFGGDAVGAVEELKSGDFTSPTHALSLAAYPNDTFPVIRRRCGRGEYSSATGLETSEEGFEGDRGGWRWDWCYAVISSP